MRIWAYDPGAVFTGMAALKWYGQPVLSDNDFYWWADTNVAALYDQMMSWDPKEDHVLVEDYSHGGAFTLEAKRTLEVVGFLTTQGARDGLHVVRRHKDKRLSGQSEAARLMGSTVAALKKDVALKDGFSAIAHTITYSRELECT